MNVLGKHSFRVLSGFRIREWKVINFTKKTNLKRRFKSTGLHYVPLTSKAVQAL